MIIAHAPAGYIVAKTYNKKTKRAFVICSILFSVWPDLDLLYYYFLDKSSSFHHTYFTHVPIVMLISFLVTLPLMSIRKMKPWRPYFYLFFFDWALHLVLDTFTGGIMWQYPFRNDLFVLIKIPPVYKQWILSFVLHWSFLLELGIVFWCVFLLFYKRSKA